MDCRESKEDYRRAIISKWVATDLEIFKPPSPSELERLRKYYRYIIQAFFPSQKEIEILEIGCGWGGFAYALKQEGYSKIDAIDLLPECCSFVEQQIGVKARCFDVFDFLKQNQKQYDVILAFSFLEHFSKKEIVQLMEQLFQALKPGGRFIMSGPNAGSLCGLYIRYSDFTHELAFTPLSINELFKAVGFQEVYCMPEPHVSSRYFKSWVKRMIGTFLAKVLNLDPKYIASAGIIGVGIKSGGK